MDDPQEAMRTGTPQATSPSTVGFNALKSDRLFVVFSDTGEILGPGPHGGGIAREGVFVDDMRVLSRLRVLIGGRPPIFMQGNVDRLNTTYETQLANEGYADRDGVDTPSQSILLTQTRRLGTGVHDRLSLRSFLGRDVVVPIAVEVHSDFRDVFEIRGVPRRDRGRDHAPIVEGRTLILSLHDLSLAARYCSRLVLMSDGRIVADGTPREVLTKDRVREVFAVGSEWHEGKNGPTFAIVEEV